MTLPSLLLCVASLGLALPIIGQVSLPARMYADSAYAPFLRGVASGDPVADGIVLWTRLSTTESSAIINWELDEDSLFSSPLQSGEVEAASANDWTVHVEVGGLAPDQIYYYRFLDQAGNTSRTGRTRTLPITPDQLKLAVMSCSSIYSGFFNAYARLAERNDLNAIIHLGDYIYDFVDEDEQIRIPVPYPTEPSNLTEWRDRHAYYLLDPDLRAMRAAHPMIPIWDNHDLDINGPDGSAAAIQAFREWLPLRPVPAATENQIYRDVDFGNLATLHLLDIDLFQDQDTLPGGENSLLGNEQFEWLQNSLSNSTARWQIIGNQVMVAPWIVGELPPGVDFGSEGVLDPTSWDGFNESRQVLLNLIEITHPGSTLIVSGDSHVTCVADVPKDPLDPLSYDPETGEGSVAVEFLPSSISRGNADEQGLPSLVISELVRISMETNPHQQHLELTQHGFGLLTINPDSIVAESWYAPILESSAALTFGGGWVLKHGTGHWERTKRNTPVGLFEPDRGSATNQLKISPVYPNPNNGIPYVIVSSEISTRVFFRIINAENGQSVAQWEETIPAQIPVEFALPNLSDHPGRYILQVSADDQSRSQTFVVY
jgi:alkaline phosphatase D